MEIVQMPYDGVMGEYHEVFTGDSDWHMTAEESQKREFVQINHYSDIDCFELEILNATGEAADSVGDKLASVILRRVDALRVAQEIVKACIAEEVYLDFYINDKSECQIAKDDMRDAENSLFYVIETLKGQEAETPVKDGQITIEEAIGKEEG